MVSALSYIFIAILGINAVLASPQFRIVGGSEAKPHSFPFLVSLTTLEEEENNCGGAILSERWILTAGHCIFNQELNDLKILAGKHDLSVEEPGQQTRYAAKFIVHPDFSPYEVGPNDIGLIYLSESLEFSKTVKPVNLPEKDSIPKGIGLVSGWGSTSMTLSPKFPTRLQAAVVPILDHEVCAEALKDTLFDKTNLCSGPLAGKIGHCSGDSGGPFVQINNDRVTIVGIISFAYTPCGSPNAPPAFTRVSHFINWIQKEMRKMK